MLGICFPVKPSLILKWITEEIISLLLEENMFSPPMNNISVSLKYIIVFNEIHLLMLEIPPTLWGFLSYAGKKLIYKYNLVLCLFVCIQWTSKPLYQSAQFFVWPKMTKEKVKGGLNLKNCFVKIDSFLIYKCFII